MSRNYTVKIFLYLDMYGYICNAEYICLYLYIIYINKNVNVRLFKILNLRKFFTDCFEILTQRCI
jgi:hypothetical protein